MQMIDYGPIRIGWFEVSLFKFFFCRKIRFFGYFIQRCIKSRDLNLLFIIDIFSLYDRRIGQSGADR